MSLAIVYDPRFHTFESWAALMCEAYGSQQLAIPHESNIDWKLWANGLRGIDTFANEAIPGPEIFDDWQEWAEALVNAVNQRSQ
jgi:hypothetical protein